MGRKHKDNSKGRQNYLDEIEAREKIKRSILKVFRARLSSPGQGGALVVGPYSTSCHSESDRAAAASEDDSSTSSMSSSPSSINREKQEKRRNVTHDTCRKRSRRKRKTSDKKKHSVGRDSSTNIKKHLSAAHNVAYAQASSKKDPWQGSSFIARTRLTQRLGLFNQGKKSKTVHREPLRCPEHILRQTEQELKEILNNRELGDLGARLDADQELSSIKFPVQNGTSNQRDIIEKSASCVNTKSVPDDSADDFPESVPLQEVADYLLSSIKPQKFFLGRDLVKEKVDELCKAMRQNAPRTATPTPDLRPTQQPGSVNRSLMESLSSSVATGHSDNDYARHQNRVGGGHLAIAAATAIKKGSKPSSTVWRSSLNSQETLMDTSESQINIQNTSAHAKCETQSNAKKVLSHSYLSDFKTCVNQHEQLKTLTKSDMSNLKKGDHQLQEQLKDNVCSNHQDNHNEGYPTQRLMNKVDGNMRMYGEPPSGHKKREHRRKEICHKSPGINLDDVPYSEAKVLLMLNEKKMAEARSHEEQMETEEYQMSMDSDAKDLLRRNELAFARRQTLSSCREKLQVSQQKNVLYPAGIVDQIGLNLCSSGERMNPTVYQVKRPTALLYPSHNTKEGHQAVVTEYNNREYMPHFHGDYYAHQLCMKEPARDFQDHFVGKTTRDSFDILDYLDKDIIVHRPRRTIVIEATPDSDGSPVWSAAEDAFIPRNPLRRGIDDLAFKMLPRHQF